MSQYQNLRAVLETYTDYIEGDPISCEHRNLLGEPVIFSAAHNGDIEALEILLAAGAEVNSLGEHRNTPLHEALQAAEFDAARLLIRHGADLNAKNDEGKLPKDCCWEGEWPDIFGVSHA